MVTQLTLYTSFALFNFSILISTVLLLEASDPATAGGFVQQSSQCICRRLVIHMTCILNFAAKQEINIQRDNMLNSIYLLGFGFLY